MGEMKPTQEQVEALLGMKMNQSCVEMYRSEGYSDEEITEILMFFS